MVKCGKSIFIPGLNINAIQEVIKNDQYRFLMNVLLKYMSCLNLIFYQIHLKNSTYFIVNEAYNENEYLSTFIFPNNLILESCVVIKVFG